MVTCMEVIWTLCCAAGCIDSQVTQLNHSRPHHGDTWVRSQPGTFLSRFHAVVRGILILCKLVLVRFSTFSETRCNSVTPVCRSAVLPVSYAFATTGIAAGLAISMVRFMPFQSLYIVYFIKVSSLFVCPRENNHQRYRTRE